MNRLRTLLKLVALCLVLISTHAVAQVTYVYTDPQGTPLAEADVSGNITATFDYTPYGTTALGTPPNGPGYTGHVNDPDTNLVYMQARYYDPVTGRFLSVDPIEPQSGDAFNFNRYAYVNDNPIAGIDPTGQGTLDTKSSCAAYNCQTFVSGDDGGGESAHGNGDWAHPQAPEPAKKPVVHIVNFAMGQVQNAMSSVLDFLGSTATTGAPSLGSIIGITSLTPIGFEEGQAGRSLGPLVEQYSLRAANSGWYPVMMRGFKLPMAITWLEEGDVWKFGTTKNPATRYPASYLRSTGEGLNYVTEFKGVWSESIEIERMRIQNYQMQNGSLPPGNKIVR